MKSSLEWRPRPPARAAYVANYGRFAAESKGGEERSRVVSCQLAVGSWQLSNPQSPIPNPFFSAAHLTYRGACVVILTTVIPIERSRQGCEKIRKLLCASGICFVFGDSARQMMYYARAFFAIGHSSVGILAPRQGQTPAEPPTALIIRSHWESLETSKPAKEIRFVAAACRSGTKRTYGSAGVWPYCGVSPFRRPGIWMAGRRRSSHSLLFQLTTSQRNWPLIGSAV